MDLGFECEDKEKDGWLWILGFVGGFDYWNGWELKCLNYLYAWFQVWEGGIWKLLVMRLMIIIYEIRGFGVELLEILEEELIVEAWTSWRSF